MAEEQQHGFHFEDWVKRTFFDIYYTSEWDIPQALNPQRERGPISIKTAKWSSSGVMFGDAIRQFEIDHPFTLIVGFWQQQGRHKKIVKVVESFVEHALWRQLWEPVTHKDLEKLDGVIKNRALDPVEAREAAEKIVRQPPFPEVKFSLNRKIDTKGQRRLQCSLSRKLFFEYLAPGVSLAPDAKPILWGHVVNIKLPGGPRFSGA